MDRTTAGGLFGLLSFGRLDRRPAPTAPYMAGDCLCRRPPADRLPAPHEALLCPDNGSRTVAGQCENAVGADAIRARGGAVLRLLQRDGGLRSHAQRGDGAHCLHPAAAFRERRIPRRARPALSAQQGAAAGGRGIRLHDFRNRPHLARGRGDQSSRIRFPQLSSERRNRRHGRGQAGGRVHRAGRDRFRGSADSAAPRGLRAHRASLSHERGAGPRVHPRRPHEARVGREGELPPDGRDASDLHLGHARLRAGDGRFVAAEQMAQPQPCGLSDHRAGAPVRTASRLFADAHPRDGDVRRIQPGLRRRSAHGFHHTAVRGAAGHAGF